MKTTYIYHSGFLTETKDCYYLFDYYRGELPPLDPDKPIFVFASHVHQDHYNREIFEILRQRGMQTVTALLAKDIPAKKYPQDTQVLRILSHRQYELSCQTSVETLQSTDAGVAFLVRCREGVLYHAGDLNDWVWAQESEQYNRQMTGSYRHEIDLLKNTEIDTAFLPLDPRQEKDYARGLLYFLQTVKVKKIFPMHYWDRPETIQQFLREYPQYREIIQNTEENKNPVQ